MFCMKINYDEDGRAISVKIDWIDSLRGYSLDETHDSYIIEKRGLFGFGNTQERVMKSRKTTTHSIYQRVEEKKKKVIIGNKEYKIEDLPPELRKKLGLD